MAKAPPKPEGGIAVTDPDFWPRQPRAVDDKMASLRSSYSLISDHNNGTLVGSAGRPAWFEMPPAERAEVLKKWGRVALTADCYQALGEIFEGDPSIRPIDGGLAIGASEHLAESSLSEPSSCGTKRTRTEDIAERMHDVMKKTIKSMEDIAQRDHEIYLQHQKEENEKTRSLLRELFSSQ
ncbi:hypothetical protein PHYSODRAFT_303191 [Phytophthora sojae]|uniref:Uncharacterized protein n=1 Tax=Phytophthora sojae (strain P6497) TaxID=1094619 RepID=G4ZRA6_PHYSP|nr:hypothetical protein PHYSODRAFT_303191 [Phytophthora sojae]EGZ13791.1 hypothetical protein PHYSODRAFT_303191 [Phytophthora sojae]|eukprot:XP_009531220.1 hypothetical protein PHYSODRAFT_303191 [Phytophthora sojae]